MAVVPRVVHSWGAVAVKIKKRGGVSANQKNIGKKERSEKEEYERSIDQPAS